MADTATPNKGYLLQETGSHAGEWGQNINDDVTSKIDTNMGGVVSKTLSNSDVTLTADECLSPLLRLNGTLSANVVITVSALGQGFFFVENLTSGAFTVTITNGIAGTIAEQGRNALMYSAGLSGGGVAIVSSVSYTTPMSVPTGTRMLFVQSAVPSGWTLYSSFNDYGLMIGSTWVSAGTTSWSAVFAQNATGSTALTVSTFPSHAHTLTSLAAGSNPIVGNSYFNSRTSVVTSAQLTLQSQGSGTAHLHTIDLTVKTLTTIAGTRTA